MGSSSISSSGVSSHLRAHKRNQSWAYLRNNLQGAWSWLANMFVLCRPVHHLLRIKEKDLPVEIPTPAWEGTLF